MNTDRRDFLKAGAASAFAMAGGAAMAGAIPGTEPIHDKYRHRVHHLYPVW